MSFINKIHDFFALGFHSSCHCTVAMSCWDSIDIRIWKGKYFNSYRFYKAPPSLVQSPFLFHNLPTQADVPFSVFIFLLQWSQGVASLLRFIKKKTNDKERRKCIPSPRSSSQLVAETIGGRFQRAQWWNTLHHPLTEGNLKSTCCLRAVKDATPAQRRTFFFFLRKS